MRTAEQDGHDKKQCNTKVVRKGQAAHLCVSQTRWFTISVRHKVRVLPGRRNVIRTDAAREVNEEARQCFEHSTCGRMKMGNTAYVGSTGILKREYINCTSIYEVRLYS